MVKSRKARLRWTAVILAVTCVTFVFANQRREPANVEKVVDYFRQVHKIPGAVLAYGYPDEAPNIVTFGVSDPIEETPMSPDQKFWLASLTKPIAAQALIEAEERGQIDLDRPIAELTELPPPNDPRATQVTARQLLAHTGGLDKTISFDPIFAPERLGLDWSASCAEVALTMWETMSLDHAPGTTTEYSNAGFCLLSGLFSGELGKELEDDLQQVADVRLDGSSGSNWEFDGHGWNRVQHTEAEKAWISGLGIAGGAIGTAEAIWSFASLPRPYFESIAPQRENNDFYASGWHVWTGEDGQHLTHWGGLRGIFTAILRFSDGETVVILFNASPADRGKAFASLHNALYQINNQRQ